MLNQLDLEASSTFIGAEIAIRATLGGWRIGEVGIPTFPRRFGRSSSATLRSIAGTIVDMLTTWTELRLAVRRPDRNPNPGRE